MTDGIYRILPHPQYLGFILISTGVLIHWPTLPTLATFPMLVGVNLHLAKREEEILKRTLKEEGYLHLMVGKIQSADRKIARLQI